MLTITIPGGEFYDEENEKFFETKGKTIVIEHSLVSISKWESKWKKPFIETLNNWSKNPESINMDEILDYIRCMTLTQNVDPIVYRTIPAQIINDIFEYMNDPMTATWFRNEEHNKRGEVVTSELVYYWMTALNITFECKKWHFNRLMVLIRIASEKNQPPKKMNKNSILKQNRSLNAQRRARMRSRG